ncbi:MAG TPA: hypothetical protein VF989_19355 [Polyangiaceae bacterium]
MRPEVRVELVPESQLDEWVQLVAASPEGSVYGGRFYERDSRLGPWVAPRPLRYLMEQRS